MTMFIFACIILAMAATMLLGFLLGLGMSIASYLFPLQKEVRMTYDNLDKTDAPKTLGK